MQETLNSIAPSHKTKPVKIETQIPSGMEMDGYPGALSQVVINLVNNSVLHALADSRYLLDALSAYAVGDKIVLQIADDGAGMDEQTAKRALEPFFTTRLGSGGSGLGLYLVYNLVTGTLGGSLKFESVVGKGTRFEITLPKTAPNPQGNVTVSLLSKH